MPPTSPPSSQSSRASKKHKTVAVFFDVAKAFGRVWYVGLIHKLYTLEVPNRSILIIHSYINNLKFTFRHEKTYSSKRTIKARVPQGSTLSSLLYDAHTNYIHDRKQASKSCSSPSIRHSA
ncbi:Probable RNA-directed DNA polymerase from transposon BS [Eumeta japonica]|uniref:Probable RNA-directed DNA polymerase from transposon BS n=1 Tax=Eumeta variegata TaxID=151549 RepID=A0A4C1W2I0_EUMVA|nr:Probable RNA-directed DNA polymerase from transposon BS [Eumeta japonica]